MKIINGLQTKIAIRKEVTRSAIFFIIYVLMPVKVAAFCTGNNTNIHFLLFHKVFDLSLSNLHIKTPLALILIKKKNNS